MTDTITNTIIITVMDRHTILTETLRPSNPFLHMTSLILKDPLREFLMEAGNLVEGISIIITIMDSMVGLNSSLSTMILTSRLSRLFSRGQKVEEVLAVSILL